MEMNICAGRRFYFTYHLKSELLALVVIWETFAPSTWRFDDFMYSKLDALD